MIGSRSLAGAAYVRVRAWSAFVLACVGLAAVVCSAAEPEVDAAVDPVAAAFDAADVDDDRMLTLEEFADRSENRDVARRDFRLFDFNDNDHLSRGEFAAIPGLVPASKRGPLPDPFEHLIDAAVESMDEAFQQFGSGLGGVLPAKLFVDTVVGSLSLEGHQRFDSRWIGQADPNGDGRVTPGEARRFVEIHLGVRGANGELLREPNGRVVAYGRFLSLDANQNWMLEPDECLGRPDLDAAREKFEAADRNRDGVITFAEFSHPDGGGLEDPITWFQSADQDLDGLIDRTEAEKATDPSRGELVPITFAAFDESGDGKLSLEEYRLSMLGNPAAPWTAFPLDDNDDGQLSFEEFRFEPARCELLCFYYFHRLDTDRSNRLSREEFPFRARPPHMFQLLATDGSVLRPLVVDDEYVFIGSPAVSPDGRRIAFDGHRRGESLRQQRILMTSIEGGEIQNVCAGLMPTWSKDGKQFACSRYEPRSGIWIIDADGSNAQWISDGWGAQWSPDGESIAFTKGNSLMVYEVATGRFREILSAAQNPYQTIYWNMTWSPDSRRLAFKARKPQGYDVASVSMVGDKPDDGGPDLRVHYSSELSIDPDMAWSRDGSRIIVGLRLEAGGRPQLCELDVDENAPPRVLKGLNPSLTYKTCCFTPDGKWIIVQTVE